MWAHSSIFFPRQTFQSQVCLHDEDGQVGAGIVGHLHFQLDPVIERRPVTMGVRERVFQAHLQQVGADWRRRQQRGRTLAQALLGAVERLLDDSAIHDSDRVFLWFHSPCYDNSFSRGLRVQR